MAQEQTNPDFKYIVRLANSDLDGKYQVVEALATVKGIGIRTAAALCSRANVRRTGKLGDLSDAEVARLIETVDKLPDLLPPWMLNRQRDPESGDDAHVHTADLTGRHRDDINRLKKIQTFRGIRHGDGQKVRGQRSRSNGRTGLTVGVIKKKEGQAPPKKE